MKNTIETVGQARKIVKSILKKLPKETQNLYLVIPESLYKKLKKLPPTDIRR